MTTEMRDKAIEKCREAIDILEQSDSECMVDSDGTLNKKINEAYERGLQTAYDEAHQNGYNEGFADGRKDVLNTGNYISKAKVGEKLEEAFKLGDKHGYERACDDQGYIDKSTFDAAMGQHEKWAYNHGKEDLWNALLTIYEWDSHYRESRFNGECDMKKILKKFTAQDVIDIGGEHRDSITLEATHFVVGDEVKNLWGTIGTVVAVNDDELTVAWADFESGRCNVSKWIVGSSITKTGNHDDYVAKTMERGKT